METEKTITLYYDKYEDEYGDGFYPYPQLKEGLIEIIITFARKNTGDWYQISQHSIDGFDGMGQDVLDLLDIGSKKDTRIYNDYGKLLYVKI
jgi:hypothetical protein